MLLAAWLTIAQVAGGGWSSGRPAECGDLAARGSNVWERAKSPPLRRYCDLVAGASSKLAGTTAMAQAALASARQAEAVLPGHAAPLALQGRALLALGRVEESLRAFEQAKARDAHVLDEPLALLAWARVLGVSKRATDAAEAYRTLLPRTTALSPVDRSGAELEAGLVTMSLGPKRLDEAAAALREAMREAQDETQNLARLALGLALDRRGDVDEAHALLWGTPHGDPRSIVTAPRVRDVLAVAPAEGEALVALALEKDEPAGATDAWQRYLEAAPNGPWLAHAHAHLAAVDRRHSGVTR
jgi:tetratricopeptide (TPR) repeat protein